MHKLLISIVPHNSGEIITKAAKEAGAPGGTILMGKGTASNSLFQLLGFGDSAKDIVFIIAETSVVSDVYNTVQEKCANKKHFGVLFTLEVENFIKNNKEVENKVLEEKMNNSHEMINVIVNKGFADDVMDAARKAGAGGGTILNARGTAKENEKTFFGVNIVPEKEFLMILVPAEKKQDIITAISSLPCLEEAGSGIIFCNPANNFTVLGKTK